MPKVTKVGKFRAKAAASAVRPPAVPVAGKSPKPVAADSLAASLPSNAASKDPPAVDGKERPPQSGDATGTATLSRGQRKRLAKKNTYLRRNRMVMSALRLKREEEQRGRLDGLDAIREALRPIAKGGAVDGSSGSSPRKGEAEKEPSVCTNKAKKDLVEKETAHMGLVLQHPEFASDPFGTIRTHLKNSLVNQAEEQRVASEAKRKEEERTEKEKKEAKKEKLLAAKVGKRKKWRRPAQQQNGTGSKGRGRRNRR